MKKLLTILFLFVSTLLSSQVAHYVAVGGGGAGTLVSPFVTIAQVNAHGLVPGDSVLFNRGDVWREELELPDDGTVSNYIYYGNYGTGAKPQILGSDVTTWDDMTGNIWRSAGSFVTPRSAEVFFNESGTIKWGAYKADTASCVAEYDWTWVVNKVYVYAATDPDARYTSVEIPQRRQCVDTWHREYIKINGIDMFYGISFGIDDNSSHTDHIDITGFTVDSCEVAYIGGIVTTQTGYGIGVVYSDLVIRNCTIHDCGRRGVSLDIYGSGFTAHNALIEKCTFYNGYHTTSLDLSVGSGNYTGSWDTVVFRRNMIYEAAASPLGISSNQIFLQNYDYAISGATVNNVFIYCNVFKYPRGTSINMEGIQSINVWNNTFYEINTNVTTGSYIHFLVNVTCTNVSIKNNIFYNTLQYHASEAGAALEVYANTDYTEVDANYNLYYRSLAAGDLIRGRSVVYDMGDKAAMTAYLGYEANSPAFADPAFTSLSDYHLQVGSPAIAAGIGVGLNTDYEGNAINNPPDLGAYAYNSIPPTPTDLATCSFAGDVGWYFNLKAISITVSGGWTDDGGGTITDAGFVISTSVNPSISDRKLSFADMITQQGYWNESITGLSGGTTYHIRVFATNESGTSYSEDMSFTTKEYDILTSGGKVEMINGKVKVIK